MNQWCGGIWRLITVFSFSVILFGCGDEADIYPPNWIYNVTVVNLTYDQPFDPVLAIVHEEGYSAWEVNTPATEEIERYAEGGEAEQRHDTDIGKWVLTEAKEDSKVILTSVSDIAGVLGGPGGRSSTVMKLSVPPHGDYRLTMLAAMMYTNDGFTGVSSLTLADLEVEESKFLYLPAYDAGTEDNTETKGTIRAFQDFQVDEEGELILDDDGDPILVEGLGEGYNDERNDINLITVHPGVISKGETDPAKQIADSALDQIRRFQQPVAKITIERTQ